MSAEASAVATRYAQLIAWTQPFGSAIVAYSGGVDSALVLRAAVDALGRDNVLALTAVGPALPQRERVRAARLAIEIGANHQWVEAGEIKSAGYRANDADRCFHCKSHLYAATSAALERTGFAVVFNGTNLDDLGDHRPGIRAASDAGIRAPLAENALHKQDVRALAKWLGLSAWDKPAAPCLASRVPYGSPVSEEVLAQIETVEDQLYALGFRIFRARHYGREVRVEVPVAEIPRINALQPTLLEAARKAGFSKLSVDSKGFVSGSLNRALPLVK